MKCKKSVSTHSNRPVLSYAPCSRAHLYSLLTGTSYTHCSRARSHHIYTHTYKPQPTVLHKSSEKMILSIILHIGMEVLSNEIPKHHFPSMILAALSSPIPTHSFGQQWVNSPLAFEVLNQYANIYLLRAPSFVLGTFTLFDFLPRAFSNHPVCPKQQ